MTSLSSLRSSTNRGAFAVALGLALLTVPQATAAQEAQATRREAVDGRDTPDPATSDIVVTGRRGEVPVDVEPLATFDARAIEATGATSIGELLRTIRGITQSANGEPPIFLLNAQRVSGYEEIGNLPPEAIEKVEVLPEPVALRYGYPPTRRVVNFITKLAFTSCRSNMSSARPRAAGRTPSIRISI